MTTEKRDLHADLAICNAATAGPWALDYDCEDRKHCVEAVNVSSWGGGVIVADCAEEADARFIAEARTGWPHAIERALTAEELCAHQGRSILALAERNRELKVEVERLRRTINEAIESSEWGAYEDSLRSVVRILKEATADDQ